MKILLVDDDVFLRDMYAAKFTEAGDAVVSVESGTQALQTMASEQFDVVLMDMVMPGMTGLELLEAMRQSGVQGTPRSIVLSNQSEESDLASAKEAGAVGYLIKAELVPSEVVQKVHALVD